MNLHRAVFAFGAVSAVAAAGHALYVFEGADHPDGAIAPPPYGLRFDDSLALRTTFSFEQDNAGVTIIVNEGLPNVDDTTITITGDIYGGSTSGANYTGTPALYAVSFTYSEGITGNSVDGWVVTGMHAANNGTLVGPGLDVDLVAKTNNQGIAFQLRPDGHRLSGDNSTWVGRGWVNDANGGSFSGYRDWLFTALPPSNIPAPGAAALLAAAGIVGIRRRR